MGARVAFASSTDLSLEVTLLDVPVQLEYDEETGEVTAYNDALRIMAVGTTPADARARFDAALLRWMEEELRTNMPEPIREYIGTTDHKAARAARRTELARV